MKFGKKKISLAHQLVIISSYDKIFLICCGAPCHKPTRKYSLDSEKIFSLKNSVLCGFCVLSCEKKNGNIFGDSPRCLLVSISSMVVLCEWMMVLFQFIQPIIRPMSTLTLDLSGTYYYYHLDNLINSNEITLNYKTIQKYFFGSKTFPSMKEVEWQRFS